MGTIQWFLTKLLDSLPDCRGLVVEVAFYLYMKQSIQEWAT